MSTDILLDSVDNNNAITGLDETQFLGVLDGAPDDVISALEARDLQTDNASADLEVSAGGLGGRQGQDGLAGSVLGEQSGGAAGLGEGDDELAIGVGGGLDSGRADRLGDVEGAGGSHDTVSDRVEEGVVVDDRLSLLADSSHDMDRVDGEITSGGLTTEHDAVSAVEDGVGDVAGFGTSGSGVLDHGLEHLSGSDYGLAGNVALGDHHLLGQENLLRRNLHTEIASGNHDGVRLSEDLVEVLETSLILNLGDNLDVTATGSQDLSYLTNIVGLLHERSRDKVDTLRDGKVDEVILVLLSDNGELNLATGQVHVLSLTELSGVQDLGSDPVVTDLGDLQDDGSVRHEDLAANLDTLGKKRVTYRNLRRVTLETVISDQNEVAAANQIDRLTLLQETGSDLRTLGVEHNGNVRARSQLASLSDASNSCTVNLVVTVTEV